MKQLEMKIDSIGRFPNWFKLLILFSTYRSFYRIYGLDAGIACAWHFLLKALGKIWPLLALPLENPKIQKHRSKPKVLTVDAEVNVGFQAQNKHDFITFEKPQINVF